MTRLSDMEFEAQRWEREWNRVSLLQPWRASKRRNGPRAHGPSHTLARFPTAGTVA